MIVQRKKLIHVAYCSNTFSGFSFSYFPSQVNLMLSHEANSSFSTRFYNHHSFLSRFYTNIYMMANAAIIMISLPIINYGLIPCLPSLSIRARMGGGLGLYTLGNFIVVIIHVCFPDSRAFANHLSLFLPPTVINALAEVMTIVSCKFELFILRTLLYSLHLPPSPHSP